MRYGMISRLYGAATLAPPTEGLWSISTRGSTENVSCSSQEPSVANAVLCKVGDIDSATGCQRYKIYGPEKGSEVQNLLKFDKRNRGRRGESA